MSEPISVADRLQAQVAAQRLQFDGNQHAAAQRLDTLCDALLAPPPSIVKRLRLATSLLSGAPPRPPPRGVYLWGGVGRGKTLIMDLFASSLASRGGSAVGYERSHFYHFLRAVHAELAAIKNHSRPLEIVAQRLAARIRVLCLDEFFVADITDAMILAGLFEGLFRRGVALVATSNLQPEDLYREGLQRQRFLPAIALIRAHCDVIHLDGRVDYRLRELERAPNYLDSTLRGTSSSLQERFSALCGGSGGGPTTLRIEGRDLRAVEVGQGTAWFEFSELCEGPRSQNDYIEIARLFHTVFIANIPILDAGSADAARRFMMLIDEFYDRGVKIVVSAAAAPAELYRGERLRFEFERVASRLIEMQTRQYLAGEHRPQQPV